MIIKVYIKKLFLSIKNYSVKILKLSTISLLFLKNLFQSLIELFFTLCEKILLAYHKGGLFMFHSNPRENQELKNRSGMDQTCNENKRRLEQLENLVEAHTRTERHLEQHSDIASEEQIKRAEELQKIREDQIEHLEDIIAYGENVNNDELKNLERNYEYTKGYMNHNLEHMDDETLNKTKEKQEHRKEQMEFYKRNKN